MKQEKLFTEKSVNQFGGSLLAGSRKTVRPLSSKKPVHLVLKATSSLQLIKNKKMVEFLICKYAHKFGIKVYEKAVHADPVKRINNQQCVEGKSLAFTEIGLGQLLCQADENSTWQNNL